jgi:hypothetical protein
VHESWSIESSAGRFAHFPPADAREIRQMDRSWDQKADSGPCRRSCSRKLRPRSGVPGFKEGTSGRPKAVPFPRTAVRASPSPYRLSARQTDFLLASPISTLSDCAFDPNQGSANRTGAEYERAVIVVCVAASHVRVLGSRLREPLRQNAVEYSGGRNRKLRSEERLYEEELNYARVEDHIEDHHSF